MSDEIFSGIADGPNKAAVVGHGQTYSAHPVSAVIALEVIKIYEESMLRHAQEVAPYFESKLKDFLTHPLVGDVRCQGLLGSIELVANKVTKRQFPAHLKLSETIDKIDYVVVRENTEGEYSSIGGIMYEGTDREVVLQQSVFSRHGTDRVLRYGFKTASNRKAKSLTVATKSNGMAISMPWWDSRALEISKEFPDVTWDKQHIDILSARFVMQPERFDVVVATNLFGDILSDLGPACTGTIGLAPSANLNPERKFPSLFEPVHGSAPDIFGKNIANPIGMIWSGALMLRFLTKDEGAGIIAHDAIIKAIESTLVGDIRTPDLGGNASTQEMGDQILSNLTIPQV